MPAGLDRQVAEAIAGAGGETVAGLGLRFDRVALRLLERLRLKAEVDAPEGLTTVVTLTAPIRVPGKTAAALEDEVARLVQSDAAASDRSLSLFGNDARLRLVGHTAPQGRAFVGFVHNAEVPAARLLDLAERWIRSGVAQPP